MCSATPVKVVLTATVVSGSLIPPGSVTFKEGAVTLGSAPINSSTGVATLSTSAITAAGSHVIKAFYYGAANFSGSDSGGNYAPAAAITGPPTGSD